MWIHNGTGDTWSLSSANVHGGSFAYHAVDSPSISDQRLTSPEIALPTDTPLTLQFWNWQEMEDRTDGCYDGGILEISTNAGVTWTQLATGVMQTDPYDGPIAGTFNNPLANLDAWCGDPQDWLRSVVELDAFAGQSAMFRFRLGTDNVVGHEGWVIDDVAVQTCVPDPSFPFFNNGFESGDTSAWSTTAP